MITLNPFKPVGTMKFFWIFIIAGVLSSSQSFSEPLPEPKKPPEGDIVLCFDDPKIPLEIRKQEPDNKEGTKKRYTWPYLKDAHYQAISSLQLLVLHRAGISNFKNKQEIPLSSIRVPTNWDEDPKEYIDKMAARFSLSIPAVGEMISNSYEELSKNGPTELDNPVAEVFDEAYLSEIDAEKCVVASISRIVSIGSSFEYYYDKRLLDKVKQFLTKDQRALFMSVLWLSDSIYWNTITRSSSNRDLAQKLTSHLIAKSYHHSQNGFLKNYLSLGFLGEPNFTPGDPRNFYLWNLLYQTYDVLWNQNSSQYHSYENEVIAEVTREIPDLEGCRFYSRITGGDKQLDPYKDRYDCKVLMSHKENFVGGPLDPDDQEKADALLEKYKDYDLIMKAKLEDAYTIIWQKLLLEIPTVPKGILESIDKMILSLVRGEMLTVFDPRSKDAENKSERELKLRDYPITFDYPIPEMP